MLALGLARCGGGSGPSSPSNPSTTPSVPTYSVTATVFYDQNGNGQLDGNENARVPGVDVVIGTGTGRSAAGSGQAVVTGIQAGTLTVALRTESLPYYFQPLAAATIQVPGTSEVRVPLPLPIGRNNPNLYLGLGDSITYGDGSSDGQGYAIKLQDLLGPHFGRGRGEDAGAGQGDSSAETAEVTRQTLGWFNPAYTLILLGTNDWHDQACQSRPAASCYTVDDAARDRAGREGLGQPAGARHDSPGQPRAGAREPQPLVRRHERADQGDGRAGAGAGRGPERRDEGRGATCPRSSPTTFTRTTPATS